MILQIDQLSDDSVGSELLDKNARGTNVIAAMTFLEYASKKDGGIEVYLEGLKELPMFSGGSRKKRIDGARGTLHAAPRFQRGGITVANFSFELPDITNEVVIGVPTDWTAPNGTGGINHRDDYAGLVAAGIPDGNQWALITFTGKSGVRWR